jgi:hypothetical protein
MEGVHGAALANHGSVLKPKSTFTIDLKGLTTLAGDRCFCDTHCVYLGIDILHCILKARTAHRGWHIRHLREMISSISTRTSLRA